LIPSSPKETNVAGDITRTTFNPLKHYSAVHQQQGRVSVDADWNEQADIAAHRVCTETADVLGRTGAPRDNAGFQIVPLTVTVAPSTTPKSVDLAVSPGRMYVDGILCELESSFAPILSISGTAVVQLTNMLVDERELAQNQWVEVSATDATAPNPVQTQIQSANVAAQTLTLLADISAFAGKSGPQLRRITTYLTQPDSLSAAPPPASGLALAYLDVWERAITALEDGAIRDPALGPASGPDTATRTKTVWQVKFLPLTSANPTCSTAADFSSFRSTAQLAARAEPTAAATSACILPPRAGFRRLENQLYRIEVHTPGNLATGRPTFKWSRDNGSVVTAIVSPAPVLTGPSLTFNVSSLGRDQVLGFAAGQFVELTDDGRELAGQPGILVQLTAATLGPQSPVLTADTSLANAADLSAFLNGFTNQTVRNPKVRRWDQSGAQVSTTSPGGDVVIQEGTPIDLESGVQVTFHAGRNYLTGDYWLVPGRTVTGDVDWPKDSSSNPQFRLAQGVGHHFCPLAIVNFTPAVWSVLSECRSFFAPLADSGLHITQVVLAGSGGALLNDSAVALQDLTAGINIICDAPVDQQSLTMANPSFALPSITSLTKPSCFVTIDVPVTAAGQLPSGAQPTVVSGALSTDSTVPMITWKPTAAATTWIQTQVSQLLQPHTPNPPPILAHLTLKGNRIWALGNPNLFLDGEVFSAPDPSGNQRSGMLLPSGDGRRGGDFEMWFWLTSTPSVVVAPASIDFGSLPVSTTSPVMPITVTNNSTNLVTIAISLPPGSGFSQTTSCPVSPATLAVGTSCTVNVTFTPTQAGFQQATLTVTPTPGSPVTIPLTGTGLAAALQASPSTVQFGAVARGSETDRFLTFTNIGSAPLTMTNMSLGGAAAVDYVPDPITPATLSPGGSVSMSITFSPNATGSRAATLTITHNGSNNPLVVTLIGTGLPPRSGGGGEGGGGGGGHPALQSPRELLQ
jgi:hypothetical protein